MRSGLSTSRGSSRCSTAATAIPSPSRTVSADSCSSAEACIPPRSSSPSLYSSRFSVSSAYPLSSAPTTVRPSPVGLARLTRLSAWWIRLIRPETIEPGKPQQKAGMHHPQARDRRSGATSTTSGPHEALDDATPAPAGGEPGPPSQEHGQKCHFRQVHKIRPNPPTPHRPTNNCGNPGRIAERPTPPHPRPTDRFGPDPVRSTLKSDVSIPTSVISNPWIHNGVENVRNEVSHHHHHREDQRAAHDHRIVALQD